MRVVKNIIALAVVGGLVYGLFFRKDPEAQGYITMPLEKGSIVERITASGSIRPISTVNIGTQVSGRISEISADYNAEVKKGERLAKIDPLMFESSVAQRRAALNVALAQQAVAANDLVFNQKNYERIKKLHGSRYVSDKDLESAERDYANSKVALDLQKAVAEQARAALGSAEIDLQYTDILSPVDGIVISREVEVGQTVAASFQTPTLFKVAEDLTKMEISASIVEADIAKVAEGQVAEFAVDAFADMTFFGMVSQVRNNPITVQNVVTYEVIISIDNKDKRLKPGMTANVSIITAEKNDVLAVSNQALRFFISEPDGTVKRYKDKGIWVLSLGEPKRVAVVVGVADEKNTEIVSGDLKVGDKVIIDTKGAAGGKGGAASGGMRMRMPR